MVLCNVNSLNIKEHHMLKCLEKKKKVFNVHIVPLTKPADRIDQYDKDNIDIMDNGNIIINSKHSKQNNTGLR
jgi:uncharacterized Fe-S cluster protein YjdI